MKKNYTLPFSDVVLETDGSCFGLIVLIFELLFLLAKDKTNRNKEHFDHVTNRIMTHGLHKM